MGVRLAAFTAGFNVLFWLSHATLGALWSGRASAGFGVALAAPLALFGIAWRMLPARRATLLALAALSLALAALVAG